MLPRQVFNLEAGGACPQCNSRVDVTVFPALFADPALEQDSGVARSSEEQAGCFYHPHKEAAVPCAGCGLFLCTLCATEIGGRQICPKCLETELKQPDGATLANHRTLYGHMAFTLALLPLLIWPVTLLTAPAALFIAIRYWKKPGSLVSRSRWRAVVAIVAASLQIFGWIAIFAGMLS